MTDARLTQEAAEVWTNVRADARMTSIFLEHWGIAGTSQPQAVATIVILEQWMTVAPPARGGPMVSMIW